VTEVLLDPTNELQPARREEAAGLASLEGVTVALLDIAKPRGSVFLDRLEQLLRARQVDVARFRKPTHAKIAPPDLRRRITTQCRATVVALAD
jgi:hypothetical protein